MMQVLRFYLFYQNCVLPIRVGLFQLLQKAFDIQLSTYFVSKFFK